MSVTLYGDKNYTDGDAGSMTVAHGDSAEVATDNASWQYQSARINNVGGANRLIVQSTVYPDNNAISYLALVQDTLTDSEPDFPATYASGLYPVFYLGIDTTTAIALHLDIEVENTAIASKSLIGGSSTTVTLMTLSGKPGYAGFMTPLNYASVVAECTYGDYNPDNGLVTWNGTGTLAFLYINGQLQLSAADDFPDNWTFADPTGQPDGSWTITVSEAVSAYSLSGLSADKAAIISNGTSTATLTAIVVDTDGNPAPAGVEVSWSTDTGLLGAATSLTNDSGQATNTLTDSGDTGTATVTATLEGSSQSVGVKLVAEGDLVIKQLTSNPTTLKNNGTDVARLYALVEDSQGTPVEGVTVHWSVDKSGGSLGGDTTLTVNTGGSSNSVSDQGDTDVLTVTASLDNGSTKALAIPLEMATDTLIISSLVSTTTTIPTDLSEDVGLTATVTYPDGTPGPAGVEIYWAASAQEGTFAMGDPTVTMSSDGATIANNVWIPNAGLVPGSEQFTALLDHGDGTSSSKQVNVTIVAPDVTYTISSLTSDKSVIANDGSQTATITAVVQDSDGNPAPAGVDIAWSTDLGTLGATSSVTDASGTATTTLTDSNSSDSGLATISATVDGNTWRTTVDIGALVIASVSSDKSSIYNDGSQTATITAVVHEADGSTAPAGVTVTWGTTLGTLGNATSQTDANGKATTTLKDSAGDTGTATVTATLDDGSSKQASVSVIKHETAQIYRITDLKPTALNTYTTYTMTIAVLTDPQLEPAVGVKITWQPDSGGYITYLEGNTSITDENGRATIKVAVEQFVVEPTMTVMRVKIGYGIYDLNNYPLTITTP